MAFKLGLLINPFAGLGGAVGLKGSDGQQIVELARALGARPMACERARRTLKRLADAQMQVLTVSGEMGEAVCAQTGVTAQVVISVPTVSSALDTRDACAALLEEGIDLLLFAGGDGTARDVAAAVGSKVPILGIPCGVKMYSGVFALSPEHASELVLRSLSLHHQQQPLKTHEAELLDIDEAALRADRVSTSLFGYAVVPVDVRHMQSAKSGSGDPDAGVEAATARFARDMRDDQLYIVGPGRTMHSLASHLEGQPTLLGVDAYLGRRQLIRDANEAQLLSLLDAHPAQVVVSITGGQGCLFGRGNQPISARVLAAVHRDCIHVLASLSKVVGLPQGRLFVDSGDPLVDVALSGFIRVETAPGRSAMVRVVC